MRKGILLFVFALVTVFFAGNAFAEITVSITSVDPLDGIISSGESATIYWKIEADGESGEYQLEVDGDGSWDSGDTLSSSDASGSFTGTTQGSSTVKSSDLTDGDGDYQIYFIAVDDSDESNIDSTSTTITLDDPPEAVTGLSAGNGDKKVFLNWNEHEAEDIEYYLVYYSRESGSVAGDYNGTDASEGSSPIDVDDVTSFTLNGLENNVKYYVRVAAVDEAGTESPLSNQASATPMQSAGAAGLSGDDGECFIATASFGDYDHPRVRILRQFRDRILAQSEFGRDLIEFYYKNSPPAADWIRNRPVARSAVRLALAPVVAYADMSLKTPALAVVLPVAFAFLPLLIFASIVSFRGRGN